jgi:glycosyltransferase involved in cell wall biosynthesis
MKVLLLDTYFGDSHKSWAEGLKKHSKHQIKILSLKPIHWKWRMQSGAISLAKEFNDGDFMPDVVLATSMVNLSLFKSLAQINWQKTSLVIYFHENQLAYPFSSKDSDIIEKRDNHYGFMQYTSALIADEVWFNSNYNKNSFLDNLKFLLTKMPKPNNLETVEQIHEKSKVIPLGFDFHSLNNKKNQNKPKTILWNHRWEEDKNPSDFVKALKVLKENKIDFNLIVTGVKNEVVKKELSEFQNETLFLGFAKDKGHYWDLLQQSDIVISTSNQEFFGISIVEAVYAGCYPILPKRLSYPEVFKGLDVFYNDFDDLTKKLYSSLKSEELPQYEERVKGLDWSKIISIYDSILDNLPNNN